MQQLVQLIDRIVDRVNINLRESGFDAGPYVRGTMGLQPFLKFYACYGITPRHPVYFDFNRCNLAGSYFFGKCTVNNAIVYKTDIRGDELKTRGTPFKFEGRQIPLKDDETIRIEDAFLIKALVHANSHDPECPEEFLIQNTIAMPYANIHGSPLEGCFLGPFSTVDLTTVHDCIIGEFAYVQTGELSHTNIEPGTIWIRSPQAFEFRYRFPRRALQKYIRLQAGQPPQGIFMDFVEARKGDFEEIFAVVDLKVPVKAPKSSSLNRYALFKGDCTIDANVLVAQRAYLENARLGKGANAQENCYLIDAQLQGNNVTAHGGTIICATLAPHVFVGFNSFLRGTPEAPLSVGQGSIVMPHTIIDLTAPLNIPQNHLVWGYLRSPRDLPSHSLPLEEFSRIEGEYRAGAMRFRGRGADFVSAFKHRIDHILEANGAYFDGRRHKGHAQTNQDIAFNIIHPYAKGPLKGLFPTIKVRP